MGNIALGLLNDVVLCTWEENLDKMVKTVLLREFLTSVLEAEDVTAAIGAWGLAKGHMELPGNKQY